MFGRRLFKTENKRLCLRLFRKSEVFLLFHKSILTNVDILVIMNIATSVDILFFKGEILCRL